MKKFPQLKVKSGLLLYFFAALLISSSCREDNPVNPAPPVSANSKVNDWIQSNMAFWYLWNNELPANPDKNKDPQSFFKSLLSPQDRFSWIQDNYQDLLNSLQGISKESGYEFVLYREREASSNVIAQILYVKPGSPAAQAGLKRGDVITHINNEQLTTTNYQAAIKSIRENHSITYKPLIVAEERFDAPQSVSLNAVQYTENPNHLSRIVEVNDKKIGYFVYTLFASGTDDNPNGYDAEMENIFANFKSQNITDLVLDLRFNSGGSERAATHLASLVGRGVDNTKIFAQRSYNSKVEQEILNDPKLGKEFLTTKFVNISANIGNQLSGGRVYVLTSSRTASASELVINALKPFMDVFLIGDVTYGKNVGSISIYDKEDATNKWGLQPIVVKVSNSLNQSDYSNGFNPNVTDKDNSLYLYPLGDTKEALLAQAIGQITGTAMSGRKAARKELREIVGHSLDVKPRGFDLVIGQQLPPIKNF